MAVVAALRRPSRAPVIAVHCPSGDARSRLIRRRALAGAAPADYRRHGSNRGLVRAGDAEESPRIVRRMLYSSPGGIVSASHTVGKIAWIDSGQQRDDRYPPPQPFRLVHHSEVGRVDLDVRPPSKTSWARRCSANLLGQSRPPLRTYRIGAKNVYERVGASRRYCLGIM